MKLSGGDAVNQGELKRLLKKNGCSKLREGKRHEIWYSSVTGMKFEVGRHDKEEVPTGTLKKIRKAAGLE